MESPTLVSAILHDGVVGCGGGNREAKHVPQQFHARKDFGGMRCILVCHPHLTIIICRTAVWAQACGSERKTSFVIIVHLCFIQCLRSFLDRLLVC